MAASTTGYTSLYGDAGVGLSLGAGLGAAYGDWEGGETNQRLDNFNASIEDQKAAMALRAGLVSSNRMGQRTVGELGAQATAEAGNGLVPGVGSSAALAKDTANIGMGDMAQIRANAAMEAWGYASQAGTDRLKGALAAADGRDQAIGAGIGAVAGAASGFYRINA